MIKWYSSTIFMVFWYKTMNGGSISVPGTVGLKWYLKSGYIYIYGGDNICYLFENKVMIAS